MFIIEKKKEGIVQNRIVGALFLLLSNCVMLWAIISFFAGLHLLESDNEGYELLGLSIIVVLTWTNVHRKWSIFLKVRSKRHFVPLADDVLSQDKRPVVLYLRSFRDDIEAEQGEIVLSSIFENVGPFIAIGSPTDKVPMAGASRHYLNSVNWKEFVRGKIRDAALIVISSGNSDGLLWEIQECIRLIEPKKVIILVVNDNDSYSNLIEKINKLGMVSLPNIKVNNFHKRNAGRFCGIIQFDDQWNGVYKKFICGLFPIEHKISKRVSIDTDVIIVKRLFSAFEEKLSGLGLRKKRGFVFRLSTITTHPFRKIFRTIIEMIVFYIIIIVGYFLFGDLIGNLIPTQFVKETTIHLLTDLGFIEP